MTTPIKPQRFRLRRAADRPLPDADAAARSQHSPKPNPGDNVPPTSGLSRILASQKTQHLDTTELADEEVPQPVAPNPPPLVSVSKHKRTKPGPAAETQNQISAGDASEKTAPNPQPGPREAVHADTTAKLESTPTIAKSLDAIRGEGLTARQLRMAMRVAQKHGIRPSSAHEAVLMLRERGIDPFTRATMLGMVDKDQPAESRELARVEESLPAVNKPESPVNEAKDRMARIAADREKELQRVQRDIAKRRRKRLMHLGARLLVFVTLPTFIATWYFYMIATPMYATESQFVIQQADGGAPGDLSGMLPSAAGMGLGGQNEAASVQSYLQSRSAMRRLNLEEGFKDHFMNPEIDLLRRLPPDATEEATFRLYQRHVLIGYDPTEGVIRMEVLATTPEDSERFARALISFAEEHVDMMTQRLRDSQMTEARQSLEDAQRSLIEARLAVVDLQERSEVMSGEVELSLISQQIGALEAELTQTRLSLQEMRSNPRPNPARLQPLERREDALRREIESLRASMTRDSSSGVSLARTQSQLIMAEAEVQTREMMRAQAMQQMESARIEVSRQVRYLALSVEPIAPDEPTYPRKLENSALAFLIFLGIYLFVSMTGSVLREQISG